MENREVKLDNLMGYLRRKQPELHSAELLTENIMKQVGQRSFQSKSTYMIWVRAISSSAAVFLLGLFVFQQTYVSGVTPENTPTYLVEQNTIIDPECAQNFNANKSNLLETYFCHLASNSIKNKRLQSFNQHFNR